MIVLRQGTWSIKDPDSDLDGFRFNWLHGSGSGKDRMASKKKEKDLTEESSEFEPCWPGKDTGQDSTLALVYLF